jgi:transmembrane sensor
LQTPNGEIGVTMNQSVRSAIADEASEWFVKNRDDATTAHERSSFASWLRTSPIHVEEYLAIAKLAIDLKESRDPTWSCEYLVAQAAAGEASRVVPMTGGINDKPTRSQVKDWRPTAAAATILLVAATAFVMWTRAGATTEHMATRHGEQRVFRLADNSVLQLDTDTEVVVRYDRKERLVNLMRGRALFEVVHNTERPFLVAAGSTEVRDTGTSFDVYRRGEETKVTVLSGEVSVAPSPRSALDTPARWSVRVHAGEQVQVTSGAMTSSPGPADLTRSTAWLRRQISVDQEPLAQVVAEFNRYSDIPITIKTAALRELSITGIFAADDTESFVAFLRSLDGVTVKVGSTAIDVSRP